MSAWSMLARTPTAALQDRKNLQPTKCGRLLPQRWLDRRACAVRLEHAGGHFQSDSCPNAGLHWTHRSMDLDRSSHSASVN